MPVLTVRQSITPEGRVQIEVGNSSGMDPGHQPCSVIFSLRSSHPHLFYYRGSTADAAVDADGEGRAGVSGGGGGAAAAAVDGGIGEFSASPSAPLAPSSTPGAALASAAYHYPVGNSGSYNDVDVLLRNATRTAATLLRVSDDTWMECNMPAIDVGGSPLQPKSSDKQNDGYPHGNPLSPDDSIPNDNHQNARGGVGRQSSTNSDSSTAFHAASLSERPLLIKEELPDGVLLPGEARMFLLDIDDPEYIAGILAREQDQREANRRWRRELKLSDPNTEAGGATNNRGRSRAAGGGGGGHGHGGRVVNFAPDVKDSNDPDSPCSIEDGGNSSTSVTVDANNADEFWHPTAAAASDGTEDTAFTAPGTSPRSGSAGAVAPGTSHNHNRNRGYDEDDSSSYRDTPPLSIMRDSTQTRDSLPLHLPADGQHRGDYHGNMSHQNDDRLSFSIATTGSQRSESLESQNAMGGGGHHHDPHQRNSTGGGGGNTSVSANGDEWDRRAPRVIFYVLYERLGDEDKCVERARAWLKKEDTKYKGWLEKYIAHVVRLEKRRRQAFGTTATATGSDSGKAKHRGGVDAKDGEEGDDATEQSKKGSNYHSAGDAPSGSGRGGGGGGSPTGSGRNADNDSIPLRGLRIVPPALGEGLRWRRDDGYKHARSSSSSGGGVDKPDLSVQAAYCAAAFSYYYGFLCDGAGGEGSGSGGHNRSSGTTTKKTRALRLPSLSSAAGGSGGANELHRGTVELPPLFASVHANPGVSKTAQKMFKSTRVGGGTVVLFLRSSPLKRLRSALKAGWVDRSGMGQPISRNRLAVPEPRYTAAAMAARSQPSAQQQQHTAAEAYPLADSPVASRKPTSLAPPGARHHIPDNSGSNAAAATRGGTDHTNGNVENMSNGNSKGNSYFTEGFPQNDLAEQDDTDTDESNSAVLHFRQTTAVPERLHDDEKALCDNEALESPLGGPHHCRVRSGRGLALFDDSSNSTFQNSTDSTRRPLAPDGGNGNYSRGSHHTRERSSPPPDFANTRVFGSQRTSTLDPSTVAAMTSQLPSPPPPLPPSMLQHYKSNNSNRGCDDTEEGNGRPKETSANSSPLSGERKPYRPIQLQNSLPSFTTVSQPLTGIDGDSGAAHAEEEEEASTARSAYRDDTSLYSGSRNLQAGSPSANSNGDSFVNMSFTKMNDILNYWLRRGSGEHGDDWEEDMNHDGNGGGQDRCGLFVSVDSNSVLEAPGEDGSPDGYHGKGGGSCVLTAAPPSYVRKVLTRINGPNSNSHGGARGNPAAREHDPQNTSNNRNRRSKYINLTPSQVSKNLMCVTVKVGNEAAARTANGVKYAMPYLNHVLDFLVSTVLGSAIPQGATAVYGFTTDMLLTPENVGLLRALVLPVVTVLAGVLLIWMTLLSGGGGGGGSGGMYGNGEML